LDKSVKFHTRTTSGVGTKMVSIVSKSLRLVGGAAVLVTLPPSGVAHGLLLKRSTPSNGEFGPGDAEDSDTGDVAASVRAELHPDDPRLTDMSGRLRKERDPSKEPGEDVPKVYPRPPLLKDPAEEEARSSTNTILSNAGGGETDEIVPTTASSEGDTVLPDDSPQRTTHAPLSENPADGDRIQPWGTHTDWKLVGSGKYGAVFELSEEGQRNWTGKGDVPRALSEGGTNFVVKVSSTKDFCKTAESRCLFGEDALQTHCAHHKLTPRDNATRVGWRALFAWTAPPAPLCTMNFSYMPRPIGFYDGDLTGSAHHVSDLECKTSGQCTSIILEKVGDQSLKQLHQQDYFRPQSAMRVLDILSGVVKALDQIHKHGLNHNDLKPDNVRMKKEESSLVDFGFTGPRSAAHIGSPIYMAPELNKPETSRFDGEADTYALGIIGLQLLWGARFRPVLVDPAPNLWSSGVVSDPRKAIIDHYNDLLKHTAEEDPLHIPMIGPAARVVPFFLWCVGIDVFSAAVPCTGGKYTFAGVSGDPLRKWSDVIEKWVELWNGLFRATWAEKFDGGKTTPAAAQGS
jgi:hypothetical protein